MVHGARIPQHKPVVRETSHKPARTGSQTRLPRRVLAVIRALSWALEDDRASVSVHTWCATAGPRETGWPCSDHAAHRFGSALMYASANLAEGSRKHQLRSPHPARRLDAPSATRPSTYLAATD